MDKKCKEGDPKCLDFDYHHEDSAKDMLNDETNLFSFNVLIEQKHPEKGNLTHGDEDEILKDWWIEWYKVVPELQQEKPEEYVKPLCKPDEKEGKFVECQETSSDIRACIGAENGTIHQCGNFAETQFFIPLCAENSSKRVLTCGDLPTFLCYPLEEKGSPVRPCRDPVRQICLSQNGLLERCVKRNFFTRLRVGSVPINEPVETTEWWEERKPVVSGQKKKDLEKKSIPLCISKKGNGKLSYCNQTETQTAACFSPIHGVIADCKSYEDKMVVSVCSEASSKRVITCNRYNGVFFCFSNDNKMNPILLCTSRDRQVCLNDEGLLEKCIKPAPSNDSSQISKNAVIVDNDDNIWMHWWVEWNLDIPVTKEEEDKYLCKPDESSKRLRNCEEKSSDSKACVSAKIGEIDSCKKFNEADLPVPICIDESSHKVTSCGDYGSAFLCIPEDGKMKPIRPCTLVNRQICLNDEGLLKTCSNLKPPNPEDEKNVIILNKDDLMYWEQWWEEWFQTRDSSKNNLPKHMPKRLCQTNNEKLTDCLNDLSNNTACVGAKAGKIGVCQDLQRNDLPVPICRESFTNKIITCGRHTLAFLCFEATEESSPMKPCDSIEYQACLSTNGKLELCVESATYFTLFRNHDKGLQAKQKEENMAAWIDWWKEWETSPLTGETPNAIGHPLCKSSGKKNRIVDCQTGVVKTEVCVSARNGKLSTCRNFKDSGLPISVCRDFSSKRIITCGNSTSAFLCNQKKGKSLRIHPCRSPSLQICLNGKGFPKVCLDRPELVESSKKVFPVPNEHIYSKYRQMMKEKNYQLRYLLKNYDGNQLLRWSYDFSYLPACVSAKNGEIETCQKIESNSDIGLPVCVEVNTSKLLTCGEFSQEYLCTPRNKNMFPLTPCNSKSRNACITPLGYLTKCALSSGKYPHPEENESGVLIRMEYKYLGYEKENITPLCIPDGEKRLKECTSDPSITFACFQSRMGIIHSCESAKPFDLSIPVCIKGLSKAVVTCGKLNTVNLCLSPDKKSSIYRPCKSEELFACFENGSIAKCRESENNYNDKYMENIDEMLIGDKEYQDFRNHIVYEYARNSPKDIPRNATRLCQPAVGRKEFQPCEDDRSRNFACLGVTKGIVGSCGTFNATELVMPVCVEKTKKVVTCGKSFKTHLCFQKNGTKNTIETCREQSQHICLTDKGFLVNCSNTESEIIRTILEENREGKTDSEIQPSIRSGVNLDSKESWISSFKKNQTLKDDAEELYNADFSGEIAVVSRLKSNKKIGRKSEKEDKLKGNGGSDEEWSEKNKKELRDKNPKRDGNHSGKYNDKKYESVKKDHDESKKSERSSEPQEKKMIQEVKNRSTKIKNAREVVKEKNIDGYEYGLLTHDREGREVELEEFKDYVEGQVMKYVPDYQVKTVEDYEIGRRRTKKRTNFLTTVDEASIRTKRNLCIFSDNRKLSPCGRNSRANFACIGITGGEIRRCNEIQNENRRFRICILPSKRHLVTCGLSIVIRYCYKDPGNSTALTLCGARPDNVFACLGEKNVLEECDEPGVESVSSMPTFSPQSDQKFYRLLCTNCTIENRFIVKGKPKDVVPELEVFTFSPQ